MREFIDYFEDKVADLDEWNDRHDFIGLSPRNWVSPIDFTPIGWINKGRKAVKAARVGYRLGKRGLSNFGRAAYRESRRHAASAGGSLIGKGARRSTSTQQSSGSSSRAYQQNGSPGGTRPSKKSGSGVGAYRPWHGDGTNGWKSGHRGPCRSGFKLQKVKGNWMCVRSSTRKK